MPNRILHESICTSESMNALSYEAMAMVDRLIVNADDYGRFDARPAVVRARCFPLRLADWPDARVSKALEEIEAVGTIHLYDVDGRTYGEFVRWTDWQRVRAARSKWPPPVSELLTSVSEVRSNGRRPQLAQAAARGSILEGSSAVGLEVVGGVQGGEDFDHFWASYPRKVGRPKAKEAFMRALRRANAREIIAGAERYRDDPNREPLYTAHPTTWLNRDGWADDPLPAPKARTSRQDKARKRIEGMGHG